MKWRQPDSHTESHKTTLCVETKDEQSTLGLKNKRRLMITFLYQQKLTTDKYGQPVLMLHN